MGMYERIPERVEAYQWLGPEMSSDKQFPKLFMPDIEKWSDEPYGSDRYYLQVIKGVKRIYPKDYIIKNSHGYYDVVREMDFNKTYRSILSS